MSAAAVGLIRFKDGQMLFGLYSGIANQFVGPLFPGRELVWNYYSSAVYGKLPVSTCTCGGKEDADIATLQNGPEGWSGTACRTCRVLVEGVERPSAVQKSPEWALDWLSAHIGEAS